MALTSVEILDPGVFFSPVRGDESQPTETEESGKVVDEVEEPSSEEAKEEPEKETDADAALVENEDLEKEKDEPETKPEDKKPVVDEKTYEIKADGETQRVTEAELIKSYERYGASTKRFQEASSLRKEAEKKISEAAANEARVKAKFEMLLKNPEEALSVFDQFAPETLHKMVESYVARLNGDQKLYDTDPDLYTNTVATRKQALELKRQQEEIARQRAEIDEHRRGVELSKENEIRSRSVDFLAKNIPSALGVMGVKLDQSDIEILEQPYRELMHSNWIDGVTRLDRAYLEEQALEFMKIPKIKAYLDKIRPKAEPVNDVDKKEEKEKKKITVQKGGAPSNKLDRWAARLLNPDDLWGKYKF